MDVTAKALLTGHVVHTKNPILINSTLGTSLLQALPSIKALKRVM